jgi:hypothetical protein
MSELARRRAAAQLLHRPVVRRSPAELAALSGGIQDQDQRAGRLQFRARDRHLRVADVDNARLEERSVLRCWAMRTTMHLIPSEDAGWMLPLFEPRNGGLARRRLAQLGLDEGGQARALRLIEKSLGDDGPLGRPELLRRLRNAGLAPRDEVRYHLPLLATAEGIACFGPDEGKRTRLILVGDWLGKLVSRGREESLGELARRYLRAFGPATDHDMARWSGLGLGEVRTGFEWIAKKIEPVEVLGEQAWQLVKGRPRLPRAGWVRLLGDWDTYMLGYRDRGFVATGGQWEKVKRGGGGFLRPTIVADGIAIGGWRIKRAAAAAKIEIEPFAKLTAAQKEAIAGEVADIGRFEGLEAAPA